MALVRDNMPPFELYQPTTVDDALALADRLESDAWLLAGGLDSLEWFKDRIKKPKAVIDLSRIESLRGVKEAEGDLVLGAMSTLAETARHPLVRERYGLLAQAAGAVGSPQIRNQGTLGGNVSQDARCWYYRNGWSCYRAGGNACFADTPLGMNREHAIFEADRCAAVSPSDTAPALLALEARMLVRSATKTREIPAEEYFVGPAHDITSLTQLGPDELLTSIRLPAAWAGARFYFEKVRDRQVWDFPLVNVAAALRVSGGRIEQARLALGGVAARPLRLRAVERAIVGRAPDLATAEAAGALATQGARPLAHNEYKVVLARNLVKRAILGKEVV